MAGLSVRKISKPADNRGVRQHVLRSLETDGVVEFETVEKTDLGRVVARLLIQITDMSVERSNDARSPARLLFIGRVLSPMPDELTLVNFSVDMSHPRGRTTIDVGVPEQVGEQPFEGSSIGF